LIQESTVGWKSENPTSICDTAKWSMWDSNSNAYTAIMHDGRVWIAENISPTPFVNQHAFGTYEHLVINPRLSLFDIKAETTSSSAFIDSVLASTPQRNLYVSKTLPQLYMYKNNTTASADELIGRTWYAYRQPRGQYAFNIDSDGNFYTVQFSSGCSLNGQVKYLTEGVFYLSGEASGCSDANRDGPFAGLSTVVRTTTSSKDSEFMFQLTDKSTYHFMARSYL
jgi:hypothetical protein